MNDTTIPNLRPVTEPKVRLFRVDLRWQGPRLDAHRHHIAQGLLDLFLGTYGQTERLAAAQEDFVATFAIPPEALGQLLQCLGVLRAFRMRFVDFGVGKTMDDVTEQLEATESWSYYPDPERAARAQEKAVEAAAAAKRGRPRFTGGG